MDSQTFSALEANLASERLSSYRQDGANPEVALGRYLWNVALSESLYSSLQFSEIALRNRLHDSLTVRFNSDAWYDDPKCRLLPWQRTDVTDARQKLIDEQKQVTPGRMVAELQFGFWTGFFNKKHDETGLSAYLSKSAFSGAPRQEQTSRRLGVRWTRIRDLRNRVFHHERIIHWTDLDSQHAAILEVVAWLTPKLHQLALLVDRYEEIRKVGENPWVDKVRQRWSIQP